jgi:DNA polymerase III epsilon subunit-like protein
MPTYTIYFDTETGGVESRHPTIQLAAIAVDQSGAEVSSFEQKISFNEADCDPEALAMNHYEAAAWAEAVTPAVTAARFAAWLRPYQSVTLTSKRTGNPYQVARLAGYNALTFDLPRLKAMFGTQFFPCEYLVRDVLQWALFWFDEHHGATPPDNFKLTTIAAWFGVSTEGAHGALADARMCAALSLALREAW